MILLANHGDNDQELHFSSVTSVLANLLQLPGPGRGPEIKRQHSRVTGALRTQGVGQSGRDRQAGSRGGWGLDPGPPVPSAAEAPGPAPLQLPERQAMSHSNTVGPDCVPPRIARLLASLKLLDCVNRHFHMICIRDKFSQNIGRQVPSKVIWDHLSTMYDMQALHESEILPFPNPERNFVLPEEIIHEVREGKVVIEEEMKEEMKEDVDPHNGADDVFSSSGSLGKATEKSSKDKNPSDLGSKEGADKRKRSRVTDKVLTANSNPSSPSAAKRRRT
ncbi:MRG/MORF4L-binding protein [Leptonychotes weddellii]|uniref:MRG/MORF4L-binding protein n=1 Tax=Leptonychotes weddellii TaxID=9713 RepID=A0A2U3Y2P4_LEPWE|nr:MRG/MORF4L-binding protein [Leptonychotes weddellii]